jgi:hypothetical protein
MTPLERDLYKFGMQCVAIFILLIAVCYFVAHCEEDSNYGTLCNSSVSRCFDYFFDYSEFTFINPNPYDKANDNVLIIHTRYYPKNIPHNPNATMGSTFVEIPLGEYNDYWNWVRNNL